MLEFTKQKNIKNSFSCKRTTNFHVCVIQNYSKHLNCFNYDSAVHFEFAGMEVTTINSVFSVKNLKSRSAVVLVKHCCTTELPSMTGILFFLVFNAKNEVILVTSISANLKCTAKL